MDPVELSIPGVGRPRTARRFRLGHRSTNPFLALLLALASVSAIFASDFYLARLGPAPLRFAPPRPKTNDFSWVPEVSSPSNTLSGPDLATGTDALVTPANDVSAPTQPNPGPANPGTETAASAPASLRLNSGASDPLSASNLLVVTPQTLVDFFRTNLDGMFRPPTNYLMGTEVPFIPPILRVAPQSQAIYRSE